MEGEGEGEILNMLEENTIKYKREAKWKTIQSRRRKNSIVGYLEISR